MRSVYAKHVNEFDKAVAMILNDTDGQDASPHRDQMPVVISCRKYVEQNRSRFIIEED